MAPGRSSRGGGGESTWTKNRLGLVVMVIVAVATAVTLSLLVQRRGRGQWRVSHHQVVWQDSGVEEGTTTRQLSITACQECTVIGVASPAATKSDMELFLRSLRNVYDGAAVLVAPAETVADEGVAALVDGMQAQLVAVEGDTAPPLASTCATRWCLVMPVENTLVQHQLFGNVALEEMEASGADVGLFTAGRAVTSVDRAVAAAVRGWATSCGFSIKPDSPFADTNRHSAARQGTKHYHEQQQQQQQQQQQEQNAVPSGLRVGATNDPHTAMVNSGAVLATPQGLALLDSVFPSGTAVACLASAAAWGPPAWMDALVHGHIRADTSRGADLASNAAGSSAAPPAAAAGAALKELQSKVVALRAFVVEQVSSKPGGRGRDEGTMAVLQPSGRMVPIVRGYRGHAELEAAADVLRQPTLQVIAYALYGGDNARYIDGAMENSRLAPLLFPDWVMRVYHDGSVPPDVLYTLKQRGCQLVDMTNSGVANQMSWRFAAASDKTVRRYVMRDIDSRLSYREALAVQEWVATGTLFHVMRDHPSHANYALSGGMWGGTYAAVPTMLEQIAAFGAGNGYLEDMNFLNAKVWEAAQNSVLQHDSVSCQHFGGGVPFPTRRDGWEHIGSVYLDGRMRDGDVAILASRSLPPACRSDGPLPPPTPPNTPPDRRERHGEHIVALPQGQVVVPASVAGAPNDADLMPFFRAHDHTSHGTTDTSADSSSSSSSSSSSHETSGPPALASEATLVSVIDAPVTFNEGAYASIRQWCDKLHPGVFWECGHDEAWLREHQPCTKQAFVVAIHDGWLSDNRVHADVPGTVFTHDTWFRWQVYVRPVDKGHPRDWRPRVHVHSYTCLASVLQAYPAARGHFPHEGLPRILHLLQHTPVECPILYVRTPVTQRYIELLPAEDQERMLPWHGLHHVYFARRLFITNESPYCTVSNPHNGGMSTYFPPPLMGRVRTVFRPTATQVIPLLIVRRDGPARAYTHHDALVARLSQEHEVAVFTAAGSLQDHINLFANARIIIAPHGAGLANLVFAQPGTRVVEIGWDGIAGMEMDNMYSRVAESLDLDYRLVIGPGTYNGALSAPVKAVLDAAFQ